LLALLFGGACGPEDEGLPPRDPADMARWIHGQTWVPGRVPGRRDHEEVAEGPPQAYGFGKWEVEVTPGEVAGLPGDRFAVDVRMVPVTDDVHEIEIEHGDWMWLGVGLRSVELAPRPATLLTYVVLPPEGSTASLRQKGGGEIPGARVLVERGEPVASITPELRRDDSRAHLGLSVAVSRREVRLVYSLGRHAYQDCGHAIEPEGDLELRRTEEKSYLLLGKVRESSAETCVPGPAHNPRLEATVTMPTEGDLRVSLFGRRDHAREHRDPYWTSTVANVTVH
jgi:hypothetical protein